MTLDQNLSGTCLSHKHYVPLVLPLGGYFLTMSAASEGHPDGAENDLDWGPGALRPWGDRKMYQDLKFNFRDLEVPNAQIRREVGPG